VVEEFLASSPRR